MTRKSIGHQRRCLSACAIVLLAILAIPVSGYAIQGVERACDVFALLEDGIEGKSNGDFANSASSSSEEARLVFDREVMETENLDDLRMNGDCSVVGFSLVGHASEAFSELSNSLKLRGWTQVEGKADYAGSFVKRNGELSWLFVNCIEFDGESAVVISAR